jgi:hypothetical protein
MRGLSMRERVFRVLAHYDARKRRDGTWKVKSPEGRIYIVDPARQTCTCPNHVFLHATCKHIRAVQELLKIEH